MRGAQALIEARGWIGTPYLHQGSTKGAGADCLGLIRGVWRALYGAEPEPVPAYTADWSEHEGAERLMEVALRHFQPADHRAAEPGDLILFRMRDGAVAKHLGLMAEVGARPSFIHAFSGHFVTESPLSAPWSRRIVARLAFP